jgi:hypothetical protein
MSKAETLFKRYLDRTYPGAFIKKIPDFKQTGNAILRGLPDYLVIHGGTHHWFEVKYVASLKTFNLEELNEFQWIEFFHMLGAGVNVQIVVFDGDYQMHWFTFDTLYKARQSGLKSVQF